MRFLERKIGERIQQRFLGFSFIKNGYFKTFPLKDEMDGFFVARMIKV